MNTGIMLVGIVKGDRGNSYVLIDKSSHKTTTLSTEEFQSAVKNKQVENAVIGEKGLECTTSSLNSLPLYDMNGTLLKNNGLTVLQVSKGKKSDTQYMLMDCGFRVQVVSEADAIKLIKQTGSINAKVVGKNGKYFISAKKGTLDTLEVKEKNVRTTSKSTGNVKNTKNKDANTQESDKLQIKYLGNTLKAPNPCKLLKIKKICKYSIDGLAGRDDEINWLAVNNDFRLNTYLAKVIRCYIAGNVGKRYKYHYSNTLKGLGKLGISKAKKVLAFLEKLGSGQIKYRYNIKTYTKVLKIGDISDKKVLADYLRLRSELCTDYLAYDREALIRYNLKELANLITKDDKAMQYIEKNVNIKGQEALVKSIRKVAQEKVNTSGNIMFICALSLAQYKRLYEEFLARSGNLSKLAVTRRRNKYRENCLDVISGISALVNEEPVKIQTEKDLGAMIFQSAVLAMSDKIRVI